MVFVVVALLIGAGLTTGFYRWVWSLIVGFAVLVAWENWASGAYSDSGNELGYSLLILAMVLTPALVGASVGWAVTRRIGSRPSFDRNDSPVA